MSQNQSLLNHLRTVGPISPLEAVGLYRVFRLAARIRELRNLGHDIHTTMRTDATGKSYARYSLAGFRDAQAA